MGTAFKWLFHWIGQGAKLWLFSVMASLCTLPAYFVAALAGEHLPDGGPGESVAIVIGIFCFFVGLAIFTAVLASQLQDNPLKPFKKPNRNRPAPSPERLEA